MPRYEIDIKKKYSIPRDISVVYYAGSTLVIAPQIAGWIVLQSDVQVDILQKLKDGLCIEDVILSQLYENKDIVYVVTQIEARRFYDKTVYSSTEEGRSLHLYLTNKCNLRCPHCYMYSGEANGEELSTSEIIGLLSDYKSIGKGTDVTISGGEPTMRDDFNAIVRCAYELGLKVKVLSNGILMTKKVINDIACYLDSVQISIDGFSEETNAIVRGSGHFNDAIAAVNCLLEKNIKTSIAITPPYAVLKKHVNDYVLFAKKLSMQFKDKPLEIKFSGELLSGRLISPSKDEKKRYLSLIEDVQKEFYGPDYDIYIFARQFVSDNIVDNCMFGVFAVTSNGNVFFCARTGDLLPVANIRTTSFEKILEKSLAAERATAVDRLSPCKDCALRFICGGGCRIEEFPELVKRNSFEGMDYDTVPPRRCDETTKAHFYDLMIRSNHLLFSPLATE